MAATPAVGTAVVETAREPVRLTGQAVVGGRKEQILLAAAPLFAERGFHGVTIDDIGAAVGISGPGIYRHFRGKDAVLAAMLVGISRHLLDGGQHEVAGAAGPAAALDRLIAWQVEFALDHPELITVQDRDLASLDTDAARTVRRLQRSYVELWVDALRGVRPGLAESAARAMAHATFGLLNSTPHSGSRLARPEMAALLTAMARAALLDS